MPLTNNFKLRVTSAVVAMIAMLGPSVLVGSPVAASAPRTSLTVASLPDVSRLAGGDRFATSAKISEQTFAPGVDVVYIANGYNFPDALSGAPVAGKNSAPVLLLPTTGIPAVIQTELNRLHPQSIVILGGAGVISEATKSALQGKAPASTVAWADGKYGNFAPITRSGTGDSIVTLPAGATAATVTATHDGTSNFVLWVLDAANDPTSDLLVNEIGAYRGTTAYGFSPFGEVGTSLRVTADGNWTVTIAPLSAAYALPTMGTGDAVFLYSGSASKLTATHDGTSNFAIWQETANTYADWLLVNEIGSYSGTVPLHAGPSVIRIEADGNWTMQVG